MPAPDVGTDQQVGWPGLWIRIASKSAVRCKRRHGKALVHRRQPRTREDATGVGGRDSGSAQHLKLDGFKNATVAIQGSQRRVPYRPHHATTGARVDCRERRRRGLYNPNGLGIPDLLRRYHEKQEPLREITLGEPITNDALLELDCTVLVPAALSNKSPKPMQRSYAARILAEGANGL